MLPARQPVLPDFLSTKLSIGAGNWLRYEDHWKQLSFFSFGASGKQIRTNEFVPFLSPNPDKYELAIGNDSGEPIPGQYVYKREPMTGDQLKAFARLDGDSQKAVMDNQPLTDYAEQKFDRMKIAYQLELQTRVIKDNELHALMASSLSLKSP